LDSGKLYANYLHGILTLILFDKPEERWERKRERAAVVYYTLAEIQFILFSANEPGEMRQGALLK